MGGDLGGQLDAARRHLAGGRHLPDQAPGERGGGRDGVGGEEQLARATGNGKASSASSAAWKGWATIASAASAKRSLGSAPMS